MTVRNNQVFPKQSAAQKSSVAVEASAAPKPGCFPLVPVDVDELFCRYSRYDFTTPWL